MVSRARRFSWPLPAIVNLHRLFKAFLALSGCHLIRSPPDFSGHAASLRFIGIRQFLLFGGRWHAFLQLGQSSPKAHPLSIFGKVIKFIFDVPDRTKPHDPFARPGDFSGLDDVNNVLVQIPAHPLGLIKLWRSNSLTAGATFPILTC